MDWMWALTRRRIDNIIPAGFLEILPGRDLTGITQEMAGNK
jgi:hypothetical protein